MGAVPAFEASDTMKISGAKVFVDGNIIGYCNSAPEIVKSFRQKEETARSQLRSILPTYPGLNLKRKRFMLTATREESEDLF